MPRGIKNSKETVVAPLNDSGNANRNSRSKNGSKGKSPQVKLPIEVRAKRRLNATKPEIAKKIKFDEMKMAM